MRIEKTVFISYRRTNVPWALAIFKDLTSHGYDVFFDFTGIASGDFERVILDNIRARAHFLVLLTPSALEGSQRADDWLRREVETALATERNIVPLMLDGFDFSSPAIANQLTGPMTLLRRYNALPVPTAYFDEAMERLRSRYLNVPLDAVLRPASSAVRDAADHQQQAAMVAPVVRARELTAQEYFEQALNAVDPEEGIRLYNWATLLQPDFAVAFNNRGLLRSAQGDAAGARADYDDAIRLKPDFADAFNNRGLLRDEQGDAAGAQTDFDIAQRIRDGRAQAMSRALKTVEAGETNETNSPNALNAAQAPTAARTKSRRQARTPSKVRRRLFLCYRRDDSGAIVGRMYDRLALAFGGENIFKDVDNIPFGVDFVEHLDREVQKCDVVFVIIGPHWLDRSRLDDPNDFVRIEIAAALRRAIPVVPLLVDGASMPRAEQLPEEIQALSRRNGAVVRHDPDFHSDMTRLLSRLG